MINICLAATAALSLTGCLDGPEDPIDSVVERAPDLDPCTLLPQDDSACAHACEPDILVTYVEAGTCVTFVCPLANGEHLITCGCNP